MSTTAIGLREISLVVVPVLEQDKMVAFYESLGFEKRTDVPMGDGYRWVEVYPPSGTAGLALPPPPPGQQNETGRQTGVILTTSDIDATHSEMRSIGVDVDAEVSRMGDPVPPMFWFRDPENNTLMVVEQS